MCIIICIYKLSEMDIYFIICGYIHRELFNREIYHTHKLKCLKGRFTYGRSRKKTDRRVIKTKKAIRNAFAKLLSEKDMNDITIKDIADVADINRKTFYNYYNGVYQLINEIEDEIVGSLEEALKGIEIRKCIQNSYIIFKKLTLIINRDMDFYGNLLKMRANANLISKITASLKFEVKKNFLEQIEMENKKLDIIADYAVSGMITVYQSWFNSDRSMSIEEVSQIVSTVCFMGIAGIVGRL